MPREELAGLFALVRGAPQAQSIAELRSVMEASIGFFNSDLPDVEVVHSNVRLSDAVRADVIVPPGTPPFPTLIYLHGGGWSIGSPSTHAKLARQLCLGSGAVVVNVDYRLAPEHPFPTPLDDCITAARWTRAHVQQYGGDPARIAIGGDSAGANLSAAVINDLRTEQTFRAALLIYGAFDLPTSQRDYDRYAPEEDPFLTKHSMNLMLTAYRGSSSADEPRMSPLRADLSHFPPSCLLCGTFDPLFGESLAMHEKLRQSGRETELHRYPEMPHAFVQLFGSDAEAAIQVACRFLKERLAS